MFYVRWKKGESRRGRVFTEHTEAISLAMCFLCCEAVGTKPYTQVPMGPDDSEARMSHDTDHWYAARAFLAHERCLAKVSDRELDQIGDEVTVALMAHWDRQPDESPVRPTAGTDQDRP